MTRLARSTVVPGVLLTLSFAAAQPPAPPEPSSETRALVEREALRAKVEKILPQILIPTASDGDLPPEPRFTIVTDQLLALGPDIAPFLVAEIEGKSPVDFHIAAYVLARMNVPGLKETLRTAAEAAERDGGEFGRDRKVWLGYSLAVTGDPEALDLLDTGTVNATRTELFGRLGILEVVSILTAPGSRPKLIERLDRYSNDPELSKRLYHVLRSLRRVADPSVIRSVTPYLDHTDAYVRDAAARVLGATGDLAVTDRLFAKLDDPNIFARIGVANAIEELRPPGKWKALLERLDAEEDASVRASFFRTIASSAGEAAIEPLLRHWGQRDGLDRALLIDAIAGTGSKKSINALRMALKDSDLRVVLRAIHGLAAIGGSGPIDSVVALLQDPRTSVELEAAKVLVRAGEPRAASRIADNLRRALAVPLADPADRDAIRARGDALIRLHDTSVLPDVRHALTTQSDPILLDDLRRLEKYLVALDAAKDDPAKWLEAMGSTDPGVRRLAYVRLADLGAASAVNPLIEAFGRVDVAEGAEVLRSLGRLAPPAVAPLVERLLVDPTFDPHGREPLRSVAAWTARRIGGPKMVEVLRHAVERRDGRDFDVMVQYAVLAGREALPLLQTVRVARLRYYEWRRGPEIDLLDRIIRDLKTGRSIEGLGHEPEEIPPLP